MVRAIDTLNIVNTISSASYRLEQAKQPFSGAEQMILPIIDNGTDNLHNNFNSWYKATK